MTSFLKDSENLEKIKSMLIKYINQKLQEKKSISPNRKNQHPQPVQNQRSGFGNRLRADSHGVGGYEKSKLPSNAQFFND